MKHIIAVLAVIVTLASIAQSEDNSNLGPENINIANPENTNIVFPNSVTNPYMDVRSAWINNTWLEPNESWFDHTLVTPGSAYDNPILDITNMSAPTLISSVGKQVNFGITKNGTLIVMYSSPNDCKEMYCNINYRTSIDNWGADTVLFDNNYDTAIPVQMPNGDEWVMAVDYSGTSHIDYKISGDDAKSFGALQSLTNIIPDGYYPYAFASTPSRLNDTLYVPISVTCCGGVLNPRNIKPGVIYTSDNGITWAFAWLDPNGSSGVWGVEHGIAIDPTTGTIISVIRADEGSTSNVWYAHGHINQNYSLSMDAIQNIEGWLPPVVGATLHYINGTLIYTGGANYIDDCSNRYFLTATTVDISNGTGWTINRFMNTADGYLGSGISSNSRLYIAYPDSKQRTIYMMYIPLKYKTSTVSIPKGIQYYNNTDLNFGQSQNISVQTVDINGNINATRIWFNATASPLTAPAPLPAQDHNCNRGSGNNNNNIVGGNGNIGTVSGGGGSSTVYDNNTLFFERKDIILYNASVSRANYSRNGLVLSLSLYSIQNYGEAVAQVNVLKHNPTNKSINNYYKFFSISIDALKQDEELKYFTSPEIIFMLNQTEVGENQELKAYRYFSNAWEDVNLSFVFSDNGYNYYRLTPNGLSDFVIVIQDKVQVASNIDSPRTVSEAKLIKASSNPITDSVKSASSTEKNSYISAIISLFIIACFGIIFILVHYSKVRNHEN